ncbi:hypothetical protein FBZ99_11847 [Rhizobium sp. ERR 1071]|nr:hypothetical protein FBZ99_11847 [Rhizobium sp. ERR1071]
MSCHVSRIQSVNPASGFSIDFPRSVNSYSTRGGSSVATAITRAASFMEMMMLPGMGLNTSIFTYFMQPDQSMQMIALHDLGRINAQILCQRFPRNCWARTTF